jgi:hypothetical protein
VVSMGEWARSATYLPLPEYGMMPRMSSYIPPAGGIPQLGFTDTMAGVAMGTIIELSTTV